MFRKVKAISRLWLVILMLISFTLGTFISYLWVMGSYYNMPENTTLLIVTDAKFSVNNSRYFNVTILNPSNSISDINITAIRLSIEGNNETYDVTKAQPSLPYLMRRGSEQTFKCVKNWGEFAGKTVRIEPVALNASTKSYSYKTPTVKLSVHPSFDPSESVRYFRLTVKSSQESEINLTISDMMLFGASISENVTPKLPQTLPPNEEITFQCNYNWEGLRGQNVTLTVKTSEGYETKYTTNELSGAYLVIKEVKFDETNTIYFNVTIQNVEDSTTAPTLSRVNLTLPGETPFIINTIPPLNITPIFIPPNQSITLRCLWDWNSHRNETIMVDVYTKQGFAASKTVKTLPAIVWNITDVKFDLDDMGRFSVNVTNTLCSLQEINVTKIRFNQNVTIMDPPFAVLAAGGKKMFNCEWNWTSFRGENVTITVHTKDGLEVSERVILPSVGLKILGTPVRGKTSVGVLYINITISNSNFSTRNVTITQITVETENATYTIDGALSYPQLVPNGYILVRGENVTIVCPWNWIPYLGRRLTVTIHTAEGFQASRTWQV